MIAQWMLYSVMVGLLFGFAAVAGESLLRLTGRQGRWVWVLALLASLALPLLNRCFPDLFAGSVVHPSLDSGARIVIGALVPGDLGANGFGSSFGAAVDGLLLWGWALLSVTALFVVAWTTLRLFRERRSWVSASVGGHEVLVSNGVGPAVVGVGRHAIVVPRWVLGLEYEEQRLVVLHEAEHAGAGDLWLLLGSLAAAVLVPWNPAVWWQVRRLRLAVEADCDARVLRHGANAFSYGEFLLNVCKRAHRPKAAALALSERKTPLLKRIEMLTTVARWRLGRGLLSLAVSGTAVTLACETPAPVASDANGAFAPLQALTRSAAADSVYAEADVDRLPAVVSRPAFEYPRELQQEGVSGVVTVQAVVGIDGAVEPGSIVVVESTEDRLNESALDFAVHLTFRPAEVDGHPVRVLIQMPISYNLVGGD